MKKGSSAQRTALPAIKVSSRLHMLETLPSPEKENLLLALLEKCVARGGITSYNCLMDLYEKNKERRREDPTLPLPDVKYLFILENDVVNKGVFQHVPLFCKYFNIRGYSISQRGWKDTLEKKSGKKNVVLVAIGQSSELIAECDALLA